MPFLFRRTNELSSLFPRSQLFYRQSQKQMKKKIRLYKSPLGTKAVVISAVNRVKSGRYLSTLELVSSSSGNKIVLRTNNSYCWNHGGPNKREGKKYVTVELRADRRRCVFTCGHSQRLWLSRLSENQAVFTAMYYTMARAR